MNVLKILAKVPSWGGCFGGELPVRLVWIIERWDKVYLGRRVGFVETGLGEW